MPTYDYICDDCGHEFEAFESIKADPQTECPTCHKPKLRRKIGGGAAVLFKGSGFYQTDYRSDSYKQAAKKEQGSTESAPKTDKAGSNGATGSTGTGSTSGKSETTNKAGKSPKSGS